MPFDNYPHMASGWNGPWTQPGNLNLGKETRRLLYDTQMGPASFSGRNGWSGSSIFKLDQGESFRMSCAFTDINRDDSFEGHTYSDRGPVYDLGEPVYRPRSRSVIPVPYTGQAHQSHPGRTIPKRDEVIMLD